MARRKRSSTILETARQRLAGLKSITPAPEFGTGLTIAAYEADINSFSTNLDAYNGRLAALDDLQNQLQAEERALRDKNKRLLSAVEAQYGSDSSQYEQAGGTRQSERKRPTRKAPTKG
jgi:hypothetical protein